MSVDVGNGVEVYVGATKGVFVGGTGVEVGGKGVFGAIEAVADGEGEGVIDAVRVAEGGNGVIDGVCVALPCRMAP